MNHSKILVTSKEDVEQKCEWFCGGNFSTLIMKQSEKTVFNGCRQPLSGYYLSSFYNSKNYDCIIGALSFLRLEKEYWKSPFLKINFTWSDF